MVFINQHKGCKTYDCACIFVECNFGKDFKCSTICNLHYKSRKAKGKIMKDLGFYAICNPHCESRVKEGRKCKYLSAFYNLQSVIHIVKVEIAEG